MWHVKSCAVRGSRQEHIQISCCRRVRVEIYRGVWEERGMEWSGSSSGWKRSGEEREWRARNIGNECHMGKAAISLHHLEDCETVCGTWKSVSTTYSCLLEVGLFELFSFPLVLAWVCILLTTQLQFHLTQILDFFRTCMKNGKKEHLKGIVGFL